MWPLRVLGRLARIPLRLLMVLGHRGLTHSIAAAALVAVGCGLLVSTEFGAGVAIGYLAHVAADACTPGGVALFAPLSSRRRWLAPRWARVPTGSAREFMVAALLTVAAVTATVLLTG